jgi:hypothetical protein
MARKIFMKLEHLAGNTLYHWRGIVHDFGVHFQCPCVCATSRLIQVAEVVQYPFSGKGYKEVHFDQWTLDVTWLFSDNSVGPKYMV